jgi:acyl-coenzyme A thioesterase PaaI-like protein
VRNPFRSIHAGALATFAETAGGLCALAQLRRADRFIPTELHCVYLTKARGPSHTQLAPPPPPPPPRH